MALYVNTNVSALNGQRNLQNVTDRMNSSFEKLSSGSRINSAKDDAAGLQISDRLTTQIIGLEQGTRNANDGISIAQIAEGALGEVTNNLQRMRQLAVQGGNRTLSTEDRQALGDEFEKLVSVNNDIANRTAYGTMKILNYEANAAGFQIQSGDKSGEQDIVTTGNAMLTSLFGDLMAAEGHGAQALSGFFATTIANTASAIANTGTLGKLVAAHMVQNAQSDVGAAFQALFGGSAIAASATFEGLTVADLATNSTIQLDVTALTNVLVADVVETTGSAGDLGTIRGLGAAATALFGFNTTNMSDSIEGFSDAQLNVVNGFATDTLLDMMSSLVTEVDKQRSKLGAEQNGLASTVRSNTTAIVNVSDSRSRIQDTDFAKETAELTRNQIIQQASTSILSQANQLPQAALSLLG